MCVTDRYDMFLAVKMALNPNTTNQATDYAVIPVQAFSLISTVVTHLSFGKEINLIFKPFPSDKIVYSSKLKEFADDNFELDKNGKEFSTKVENTVGKGEIARYVQVLFTQCFQKTCTADT